MKIRGVAQLPKFGGKGKRERRKQRLIKHGKRIKAGFDTAFNKINTTKKFVGNFVGLI